jgi:hypothetical protein
MSDELLDQIARRARARGDRRWDERPAGPLAEHEQIALGGDVPGAFDAPTDAALAAALATAQRALQLPAPAQDPRSEEEASDDPAGEALRAIEVPPSIMPANAQGLPANTPGLPANTQGLPANTPGAPGWDAVPRAPANRRAWAAAAAGLVLAAGLLVAVQPAPTWQVTEAQATAVERSAREGLALMGGGEVQLLLQPDTATSSAVEVRALLQARGTEVVLPAEIERSPAGSLRLRLRLPPTLPAPAGVLRVELTVGRLWSRTQVVELDWTGG